MEEKFEVQAETGEGGVAGLRLYCSSPDVLAAVGRDLGVPALKRPYRSPPER